MLMTAVRVTKVLVSVVSATEVLVAVTVFPVEIALMNLAHETGVSVELVFPLIDTVAD